MLQCNCTNNLLFWSKLRLFLCEIRYCCTLMKTRTATHNWVDPHTIVWLFSIFPCKINKLFKSEGRLEGFKVSSWFIEIMKLIEYRLAIKKKRHDFHHCWRWLHHHYSRGYHVRFYLPKQSLGTCQKLAEGRGGGNRGRVTTFWDSEKGGVMKNGPLKGGGSCKYMPVIM